VTRVLLTGAGGRLGTALAAELSDAHDVVALSRGQLDVTSEAAVRRAFAEADPEVVVNAAAYTDVDGAERDPRAATAVNETGVGILAATAAAAGALLVHVSTDYVFDGRKRTPYVEEDRPRPINAYGASKRAGERIVRRLGRHLVVRTQAVFAPGAPCFPESVVAAAEEGRPIRAAEDAETGVAFAPDLARAIRLLVERGARGLFHVANRGAVTWADLARAVLDATGHGETPVLRVAFDALPARPAPRPRRTVLSPARYEAAVGEAMPSWRHAVRRFASACRAPGRRT
jgi:dTDP-4-dehydrorhamnose reductase